MRSWLALIAGPGIALGVQSLLFAMVTPSCATQSRVEMHVVAAVALLVVLVLAVLAASDWALRHGEPGSADDDTGAPHGPRRFLGAVATAVAALSALVIAAMWFNVWVLSPCHIWP